jgi:hypothetical protein
MKRIIRLSLFFLIITFSFNVSAQVISWEIKQHSTDIATLEDEVTAYMNDGYVPLGITYDNVELYILYVHDPDVGAKAWSIEWYETRDDVQNGITSNMNQGYVPMGITYTGELIYVLYLMIESTATAWRLEPSAVDLQSVHDAIQPYVSQGYIPVGITAVEGEYWTLLLLIPDTTVQRWLIETYTVGTHADPINSSIEQGYVPWGIMYRDELVDILYVGF